MCAHANTETAAVFGPTRTTVTDSVAKRIDALVALESLREGEVLFHVDDDRSMPLEPYAWTRLVQATFKAHSGVALSPKDCRASFVTWMRDGDHGDETLRAAAKALKHSSAIAASAAYDKHGTDRVVSSAVQAADDFARRFAV
jgi:integrase